MSHFRAQKPRGAKFRPNISLRVCSEIFRRLSALVSLSRAQPNKHIDSIQRFFPVKTLELLWATTKIFEKIFAKNFLVEKSQNSIQNFKKIYTSLRILSSSQTGAEIGVYSNFTFLNVNSSSHKNPKPKNSVSKIGIIIKT